MTYTFPPRLLRALPFFCSLLVVMALGYIQRNYAADDAYIYAKFARCLSETGNWSFNCTAAPVYSTTSGLWTLLLAGLASVGIDPPVAIPLLNIASIFLLACALIAIFDDSGVHIQTTVATSVSAVPVIWQSQGIEMSLAASLAAWTIFAFLRQKEFVAGILLGLAILARPDSAIAAVLLLIAALWKYHRVPFGGIIAASLVVIPWLLYSEFTFGSIVPSTLGAKMGQTRLPVWDEYPPFLPDVIARVQKQSVLIAPLCAIGLSLLALDRLQKIPVTRADLAVILFGAYGLLHGVAYALLSVPSAYFWYEVPFVGGSIAMALLGISKIAQAMSIRKKRLGPVAALSLGSLLFFDCYAGTLYLEKEYKFANYYRAAGDFISRSAASGDRVAAGEIGYLGYYTSADILDIHGLIHPEALESINGGNWLWWLDRSPEWIVVHSPRWYGEPGFKEFATEYFEGNYERKLIVARDASSSVEVWKRRSSAGIP